MVGTALAVNAGVCGPAAVPTFSISDSWPPPPVCRRSRHLFRHPLARLCLWSFRHWRKRGVSRQVVDSRKLSSWELLKAQRRFAKCLLSQHLRSQTHSILAYTVPFPFRCNASNLLARISSCVNLFNKPYTTSVHGKGRIRGMKDRDNIRTCARYRSSGVRHLIFRITIQRRRIGPGATSHRKPPSLTPWRQNP